jgi:hypothetical protein
MEGHTAELSKRPTGFLSIPCELWLQIYRYCLRHRYLFNTLFLPQLGMELVRPNSLIGNIRYQELEKISDSDKQDCKWD